MNRYTLLTELAILGITPPGSPDTATLFEVVDALRRNRAGENPRKGTPEVDPWPQGRAVSRFLASLI